MLKKVFFILGILAIVVSLIAFVLWQSKPLEVQAPVENAPQTPAVEPTNTNPLPFVVETYQSINGEYEISYPSHYLLSTSTVDSGVVTLPASFSISSPEEEHAGTNLIESAVLIGELKDDSRVTSCATVQDGERLLGMITISGSEFTIFTHEGAAAGNVLQSVRYRTEKDAVCYEISLLIHSGNIGNYPEGTVQAFDHNIVLDRLKTIFYSFKFLK